MLLQPVHGHYIAVPVIKDPFNCITHDLPLLGHWHMYVKLNRNRDSVWLDKEMSIVSAFDDDDVDCFFMWRHSISSYLKITF